MKKLIVSAMAFTLISFASVQASAPLMNDGKTAVSVTVKEEKVPVKPENLPEGIKKTIKSDEFTGWTVKKAFLVTEENNKQYYELQVAKGSESARVKLDKEGNNVG